MAIDIQMFGHFANFVKQKYPITSLTNQSVMSLNFLYLFTLVNYLADSVP